MKREGRQHGMVRTYRILPNLKPETRFITRFDSPTTAGLFTKVTSKPTNHSKFTGKCGTPRCTGCHLHPVSKSKNKSKGNLKHKKIRVMDQPDSKFSGLSATVTLNHLFHCQVDDDEVEYESGDYVDYHVNYSCSLDEEVVGSLHIEQVEEEKYEDEDWCLVECCS
uniref:Uncharacterized protein LOC101494321 n=1 Tax=Cicer arietinum TaxID=3827 RepID=A0A1S2XGA8_CICAR|nr:uncharacterized protein LOC101494321 [Cicer arietinum]